MEINFINLQSTCAILRMYLLPKDLEVQREEIEK